MNSSEGTPVLNWLFGSGNSGPGAKPQPLPHHSVRLENGKWKQIPMHLASVPAIPQNPGPRPKVPPGHAVTLTADNKWKVVSLDQAPVLSAPVIPPSVPMLSAPELPVPELPPPELPVPELPEISAPELPPVLEAPTAPTQHQRSKSRKREKRHSTTST